jgi:hypothetical protein
MHELNTDAHSKGRSPGVFAFNPLAEAYLAHGKAFTPKKDQASLVKDLANLPQFLCGPDDIVLVPKRPSLEFLSTLKGAGFALPEFIELEAGQIPGESTLHQRKIGRLRPWAWGPDSVRLFEPLFAMVVEQEGGAAGGCFNDRVAKLYSKTWSAGFLRRILSNWAAAQWICTPEDVGVAVNSFDSALEAINAIRSRGHHRVVAKRAYGLAGQNSIRLWEPELLPRQRLWLEHAVVDGAQLVIEPWLQREMDFSIQLEMGLDGLCLCGFTGLINDVKGQFQANWAAVDFTQRLPEQVFALFPRLPEFPAQIRRLYEEIGASLEVEFSRAGYFGPAGIDAFVYRTAAGACRVKPIVEVNPRYTMGRLAVELMKRVCPDSCGLLRLINRSTARAAGFASLTDYAHALLRTSLLRLEGEPVPKIRQGLLCLNEPARAEAYLAVFHIGRSLEDVLSSE